VVYGSRFLVAGERARTLLLARLANRLLTGLCNIAADLNLTDVWTCYKVGRTALLRSIPIRSDGFGMEPELTIKLSQRRARIYETPISYSGRTYEEGKKIKSWMPWPASRSFFAPGSRRMRTGSPGGNPGRIRRRAELQPVDGGHDPAVRRRSGAGNRSGHRPT